MVGFACYNIQFKKHGIEDCVVVTGEIKNETVKDYHTAVFRISLFNRQKLVAIAFIKIKGFGRKRTRPFEAVIKELRYSRIPQVLRHNIEFETGY